MLNPIEKPDHKEFLNAKIVGFTVRDDGTKVVRYRRESTQRKPIPVGACVMGDFVFEAHVPNDGPATWWQVFDRNPAFDL